MTTLLIAGGGTGGHLTPALAIAAAVHDAHPEWRIVLIGARRGIEAELLPRSRWPHHLLSAEPIYRRQWWRNLRWPVLAVRVLSEADRVLEAERPAAVIGTGGYAAGPLTWLAARRGIPTGVFEADAFPGFTTRRLARVVREVWLGVPEAAAHLQPGPSTTVTVTGVPIQPPDPTARATGLVRFGIDPALPVVLVTGGSQGARAINDAMAGWIESDRREGEPVQVIWSTGPRTFETYRHLHAPPRVHVTGYLHDIAEALALADLAVTRAGMLTIAELCAWGIPAILVPLPTSAGGHQARNARVAESAGSAIFLDQAELSPTRLGQAVRELLGDRPRLGRMASSARDRGRPTAVRDIAGRIGDLTGVS